MYSKLFGFNEKYTAKTEMVSSKSFIRERYDFRNNFVSVIASVSAG